MINSSKDMRSVLSDIRDQGPRQTCMAFASSDAQALAHGRPMHALSVEYAHYHACRRMPTFDPHQGTSRPAMFEAIRVNGQPPEAQWPYLASLPVDLSTYEPPVNVSGLVKKSCEELSSLDEADAAIEADVPVIMGLALSAAFFRLRDGSVLGADLDTIVRGTHAIIAVGRFTGPLGAGYLIRNSWGSKWGALGYGLISHAYVVPRVLFLGVFRA